MFSPRWIEAATVSAASLAVVLWLSGVGRTYQASQHVFVLAPVARPGVAAAELTLCDVEDHARLALQPAVVDEALGILTAFGVGHGGSDPRAALRKCLQAEVECGLLKGARGPEGLFAITATSDSPQNAHRIADVMATVYCRVAPPGTVTRPLCRAYYGLAGRPLLDRPWKVIGAGLLGLLASASAVVFPVARGKAVGRALH